MLKNISEDIHRMVIDDLSTLHINNEIGVSNSFHRFYVEPPPPKKVEKKGMNEIVGDMIDTALLDVSQMCSISPKFEDYLLKIRQKAQARAQEISVLISPKKPSKSTHLLSTESPLLSKEEKEVREKINETKLLATMQLESKEDENEKKKEWELCLQKQALASLNLENIRKGRPSINNNYGNDKNDAVKKAARGKKPKNDEGRKIREAVQFRFLKRERDSLALGEFQKKVREENSHRKKIIPESPFYKLIQEQYREQKSHLRNSISTSVVAPFSPMGGGKYIGSVYNTPQPKAKPKAKPQKPQYQKQKEIKTPSSSKMIGTGMKTPIYKSGPKPSCSSRSHSPYSSYSRSVNDKSDTSLGMIAAREKLNDEKTKISRDKQELLEKKQRQKQYASMVRQVFSPTPIKKKKRTDSSKTPSSLMKSTFGSLTGRQTRTPIPNLNKTKKSIANSVGGKIMYGQFGNDEKPKPMPKLKTKTKKKSTINNHSKNAAQLRLVGIDETVRRILALTNMRNIPWAKNDPSIDKLEKRVNNETMTSNMYISAIKAKLLFLERNPSIAE